ncbi:MAG: hypothetical protein L3J93_05180, partial [Thermoplasmata archaeon]|nr:hypothetical protein [Thermoplasmata archaeon]
DVDLKLGGHQIEYADEDPQIHSTFEAELRENPSSRKGELARQTFHRASQVARDVIEARMTKILSQAFQASIGGTKEIANALPEERTLFDDVVGVLRTHRGSVAPFLEPTGPAPAAPHRTPSAAPVRVDHPSTPPPKVAAPAGSMVVRILKESPPVEIGAETIALGKEDLLSLPEAVARILIDGKIAEAIRLSEPPT